MVCNDMLVLGKTVPVSICSVQNGSLLVDYTLEQIRAKADIKLPDGKIGSGCFLEISSIQTCEMQKDMPFRSFCTFWESNGSVRATRLVCCSHHRALQLAEEWTFRWRCRVRSGCNQSVGSMHFPWFFASTVRDAPR